MTEKRIIVVVGATGAQGGGLARAILNDPNGGQSVRVAFMMPSEHTLETLPVPNDSRVTLRQIPTRKFAATRFSGRWTEENFREHTDELTVWIQK